MVPMLKMLNLLLLLLLPSLLSLGPGGAIAQTGSLKKSTTPFHVGVILDTESWIGNISWSCMTMALQDFYATHRNYTTRLAFHLRDSGHDPLLGAASAAIDLLKNVQVRAIIGPQRSAEAKFVMHIGDRTQVPIISFSAKSPSLSSKQAPYFIRTAWNDSSQAKVIASFVQAFGWGEVVPVFEDTEYDGIVPYLIDAFQEIDAHVPYRSIIPPSFTKDQILEELKRLKKMQTRVFVVHMSYSLGFQFFSSAKQAGMMEKEYVWITTYSVTDIVDLLGSSATDVMQGVLGVKPYVNETKKLTDFKVRWRKKFHHENSIDEVAEPTFFGLWAYDTVWALAIAAESVGAANYSFRSQVSANSSTDLSRLGYSPTGPELRGFMQSINFSGMSGEFHMVDGQLESKAFEIINVVEHGKRRIGFWTPAYGISQDMDSKAHVKDIMWPGKSRSVPKGSEWPTMGIKLRIGVPVKPGFLEFVNTTHQPGTNKVKPTGFCIEVFDAVMKALPYTVDYEYFRYEDSKGESNGTYDDLVYQVYLQMEHYNARLGSFGDITARNAILTTPPADWWLNYGEDFLELQTVAIRVLSQTTSSSNCERNWSTFSLIHTRPRNRLSMEKLDKLVYIQYNLKLRSRTRRRLDPNERKKYSCPVDLDYIFSEDNDPLAPWIEEGELPVMDAADDLGTTIPDLHGVEPMGDAERHAAYRRRSRKLPEREQYEDESHSSSIHSDEPSPPKSPSQGLGAGYVGSTYGDNTVVFGSDLVFDSDATYGGTQTEESGGVQYTYMGTGSPRGQGGEGAGPAGGSGAALFMYDFFSYPDPDQLASQYSRQRDDDDDSRAQPRFSFWT